MENHARIVVLASGRGSNFVAIAEAIDRGEIAGEIVLLVTDNPQAKARESARARGIPTHFMQCSEQPGRMGRKAVDQLLEILVDHKPDLIILAGFMRVLARRVVAAFRGQILNIHPSLLPSFPGLDAPAQALAHGVRVSGCTVHFVDEGTDTGPIILQAAVTVLAEDSPESLAARILHEEHRIYPLALQLFCSDRLRSAGRRVQILPERA